VFVRTPAAGTWTIEVIAGQVNADGRVETPATDADFALVTTRGVYGRLGWRRRPGPPPRTLPAPPAAAP
jgi:hypothetical protein